MKNMEEMKKEIFKIEKVVFFNSFLKIEKRFLLFSVSIRIILIILLSKKLFLDNEYYIMYLSIYFISSYGVFTILMCYILSILVFYGEFRLSKWIYIVLLLLFF